MSCPINYNTVKKGIENKAIEMLVESGQFERIDQNTVKSLVDNNDSLISNINNSFGEELVKKTDDLKKNILVVEELKKIIPNIPVKIINDYIDVVYSQDAKAVGKFEQGLITLSKKSKDISKTAKHEAFHAVFAALKTLNPKLYEQILNEGSKKYGIERGESKANVKYSVEQENQINYSLKAINNIQDNITKVNNWFKQLKDTPQFWTKIQNDLQIPKQQIELLKQTEGNTIEEKLANFAANYSYTIEINTAKFRTKSELEFEAIEWDELGFPIKYKNKITGEIKNEVEENSFLPTQYYSNLTVPGGTNYTENEIATPAITPSIKGHAQFATDKGIGWFRSDDSEKNKEDFYGYSEEYPKGFFIKGSKTRRILEVQSDLFQKGRDKEFLVGKEVEIAGEEDFMSSTGYGKSTFEFRPGDPKQNAFLQLLNKDNNWVTFFVKSIIQDSAKRGYQKILFPTGNTASKVEGHTTLEEFKKQKEDRIKELENKKQKEQNEFGLEGWRYKSDDGFYKEHNRYGRENLTKEVFNNALNQKQEKINNEINQLKQELEKVEREGFGALRPIYRFYEETVTNILKKQGLISKQITDEYGNTWNEIEIKPEFKEQAIRFSSPDIQYTGDLAIEEKLADEYSETKTTYSSNIFTQFFQWVKDMTNLIKNKSKIDKLFNDINAGRFRNVSPESTIPTYSIQPSDDLINTYLESASVQKQVANKSQERLKAIQEIFNTNPELSKVGDVFSYAIYLDTIFLDSEVKEMDNSLYISVLKDLQSNKIIEKQCP